MAFTHAFTGVVLCHILIVTPHKGLLGPRRPRHSGRCPAGNYLPRRAASRWCNSISLRVPRTMLFHIEPKTCPSPWGTPAEECRARLHNGPDARRSCICRHTRYRGTRPNFTQVNRGIELFQVDDITR